MRRHATILVNAGFEVLLVGRLKSSSLPLQEEVFGQKRINCIFEKGKLFYLEFNLRLLIFLLGKSPFLFLAVDLDTLLPNTLAAILKSTKLTFDSHEYFTEVPELVNRSDIKAIWNEIAKICIPYAAKSYTVGEALAAELSLKYNQPFGFIQNVPPLNTNQSLAMKTPRLIVYQGALNKGRALEPLILAMKLFEGKLLVIGEGDLSDSLRLLVQTEKLNEKVEFAGWIRPAELQQYTQKAWLGYNLLEPESKSYYFSLANKFFDYIHAEVPQLCPPFPEYISINNKFEVAIICQAKVEEIASTLNNLANDQELYKKLENNCRMAAKAYNLQRESVKLIQIYKAI